MPFTGKLCHVSERFTMIVPTQKNTTDIFFPLTLARQRRPFPSTVINAFGKELNMREPFKQVAMELAKETLTSNSVQVPPPERESRSCTACGFSQEIAIEAAAESRLRQSAYLELRRTTCTVQN